MLNRTEAPHIKDAIEFDLQLKPYHHLVLDNGVKVYTIDAGSQEVLQMEIVFYAGNSYESANAVAAATIPPPSQRATRRLKRPRSATVTSSST